MSPQLPPLRPLHPAWPIVGVITFVGGAITSAMAGSTAIALLGLIGAAAAAWLAAQTIGSQPNSR